MLHGFQTLNPTTTTLVLLGVEQKSSYYLLVVTDPRLSLKKCYMTWKPSTYLDKMTIMQKQLTDISY